MVPVCQHEAQPNPEPPRPMVAMKGNKWLCRDCGAVLIIEEVSASPHLVAELESIIAEKLEQSDG